MKTKIFALTFSFLVFFANAQTKGSISISKSKDKISYKQFIAPVALITTGALMVNTALNDDLQKNANNFFGEDFSTHADNILLFVPVAQIYLGKSFGFKPKKRFSSSNHQYCDCQCYGGVGTRNFETHRQRRKTRSIG